MASIERNMESYNFSNFSNFGDFDNLDCSNFNNCYFTNSNIFEFDLYKDSVIFELIYKLEYKSFSEAKIEEYLKYGFNKGLSPLETSNIIIGKKLL